MSQPDILFCHQYLRIVLEKTTPPTLEAFRLFDDCFIQPKIITEQPFHPHARPREWKPYHAVCFVENPPRVFSRIRQVIRQDAENLMMPSHFQDLVENRIHCLSYLFIANHVNIVKDHEGFGKVIYGDRFSNQSFVKDNSLGFDFIQRFVFFKT